MMEKEERGIDNSSQNHSAEPTWVLILINNPRPPIFNHKPLLLLLFLFILHEHLASDCIRVPATPASVFSRCLSLFSHAAGGWLAQERGIINFLEWQTLDVWRDVLSRLLLGVSQPPSLLPVIVHLCISYPLPSPPKSATHFIHLKLSQG